MKNKLSKFILWFPAAVTLLSGIITAIIVIATGKQLRVSYWATIFIGVLYVFALTALNKKFKLGIPLFAVSAVCLHLVLSIDCGTVLGFYDLFSWWDLMSHGMFGLVYCVVLLYLYRRFHGKSPNLFGLVSIFLMLMGLAALWEVFEFTAGAILNIDMQCVEEAIAAGQSPVIDTMTDIIIAIAGSAIFYITYFVDIKTGNKLYKFHE